MPDSRKTTNQDEILLRKLLDLKDNLSPLNVIFDSLEQSANPVLLEYIYRANKHNMQTVQISIEGTKSVPGVQHSIRIRGRQISCIPELLDIALETGKEHVIIVDSTASILFGQQDFVQLINHLKGTLSSLVVVCHLPIVIGDEQKNQYSPQSQYFLYYLATAVIYVRSLQQHLVQIEAAQTSKASPIRGIEEECEGLIVGVGANCGQGIFAKVEYRRQSGRVIGLAFVLELIYGDPTEMSKIRLAHEHDLLHGKVTARDGSNEEHNDVTFNLQLSQLQREARAGVTLPYLDAQNGESQGGRILYTMDRDDDFDDEEDEL